jgi:hypothetical protein
MVCLERALGQLSPGAFHSRDRERQSVSEKSQKAQIVPPCEATVAAALSAAVAHILHRCMAVQSGQLTFVLMARI